MNVFFFSDITILNDVYVDLASFCSVHLEIEIECGNNDSVCFNFNDDDFNCWGFCNDDKFMMFEILVFAKTNIIIADSLWTQINGFLLSLNLGGRRRWYSVYQSWWCLRNYEVLQRKSKKNCNPLTVSNAFWSTFK